MKFKIDENLPLEVAEVLNEYGYNAETVFYEKLTGTVDEDLIKICKNENRCLITLDKDFTNLEKYPPTTHAGIIHLKLQTQGKESILN